MFIITQSEAAASLQACGTYKGKPQTGNQQTGNTSAYKRTRCELNNFVPLTPVLYLYGPQ